MHCKSAVESTAAQDKKMNYERETRSSIDEMGKSIASRFALTVT